MAAWIILFFAIVFIAACKGDMSGLVLIGKIALGIGLFIIIGLIITQPVILYAVLIIGGIALAIYLLTKKVGNNSHNINLQNTSTEKSDTKTIQGNPVNTSKSIEIKQIAPPQQNQIQKTEFQKELANNTKTKQEIRNEKTAKEKEFIVETVSKEFAEIKKMLLDKARTGQYDTTRETRKITIDYQLPLFRRYIDYIEIPNDTLKSSYVPNGIHTSTTVMCNIGNQELYDFYLLKLKELTDKECIQIRPIVKVSDMRKIAGKYNIPCRLTNGVLSRNDFKPILECSITY